MEASTVRVGAEELDLHLYHVTMAEAVVDHGAGLKPLALSCIDLEEAEACHRLFKVMGETLLSLKVDRFQSFYHYSNFVISVDDDESLFDIKTIFALCPRLEELGIYLELSTGCEHLGDVVDMYFSYGNKLKKIDGFLKEGISEEVMLKIAGQCPSAVAEGVCLHQSDATNLLGILGSRTHVLDISEYFRPAMPDFSTCLSTKSANVEQLKIGIGNSEAFFSEPKPKLRSLKLVVDGTVLNLVRQDIVSRVARITGGAAEARARLSALPKILNLQRPTFPSLLGQSAAMWNTSKLDWRMQRHIFRSPSRN